MAAPVGNLSNAPILIKPVILGGKSTIKNSTELANVTAQSRVLKQHQADNSPDAQPSVMVTQGKTNGKVTIVPKVPTDGFSSRSTEYALSVIGVLCIVYGIVAK
jgi:hypothetical protein